jgi:hypothetical protein
MCIDLAYGSSGNKRRLNRQESRGNPPVGGAPVKRRTVFARGAGARAAVAVSSAVVIVIAVVNELTNTT